MTATIDQNSPVLVIGGPTATGKSALAVALAERLGGEVINGDSMQVYRGLPILTAQPDAATRARAPHRLYGVLDLDERCSAGRWLGMALAAIGEAGAAGRVPIVVGGTGMYLRALMGGLADIPDIPAALRGEIAQQFDELGAAAFHAALAKQDPEMAARLVPTDRQRLIRAAEVLAGTGHSLAHWQRETKPPMMDGAPLTFRTVLVNPPRQALYAACDERFAAMLAHGAVEEARRVAQQHLSDSMPGMKTLGLRELIAHIRGELDLEAAIRYAELATRHYAKRQTTWFNRQFIADCMINEKLSEPLLHEYIPIVIKIILTPPF